MPLLLEEMLHSLRVKFHINQAVAVVDLDVEHLEHSEAEESGDFCPGMTAEGGEVNGDGVNVRLLEAAETQRDFGAVHFFHVAAKATNAVAKARLHLGDLTSRADCENVVESAGVEDKKCWRRIVNIGGD